MRSIRLSDPAEPQKMAAHYLLLLRQFQFRFLMDRDDLRGSQPWQVENGWDQPRLVAEDDWDLELGLYEEEPDPEPGDFWIEPEEEDDNW
jgi:hypothetical protein